MSLEIDAEFVALCNAVVDELNAGEFSQDFTAERFYNARKSIEDVTIQRIAVFPRARRRTRVSRGLREFQYDVTVAVIKKVSQTNTDEADAMLLLAQELAEHLEDLRLPSYQTAQYLGTEIEVPYQPDLLRDESILLAPATLTYTVYR